ncbi:collectin-12-like isoform X2 [Struthio camelus]|uniref:collectin-12-like isoform X2 n=1 Tax=Struthio camelus TaxID=8801 RepID=UPI00360410F0
MRVHQPQAAVTAAPGGLTERVAPGAPRAQQGAGAVPAERRLLGGSNPRGSASQPGKAMEEPDLYENVGMKQPFCLRKAAAPGSAAAWRRALGTALALATVLALGASLAAVGALYARAERELRAARAAAAGASALPGCALDAASHGPRGGGAAPGGAPSCADRLGRLVQRLSNGWKYHDGKIYYFSSDLKSWQDAEDFCVSEQSHLTSVTSREQQEYLVRNAGDKGHWIGLTDLGTEGTWRWVDGTEYRQNMSFWAPQQPDNWDDGSGSGEDCAHLQPEDSNLWNDKSCSTPLHWICEKRLDVAGL